MSNIKPDKPMAEDIGHILLNQSIIMSALSTLVREPLRQNLIEQATRMRDRVTRVFGDAA